MAGVKERMASPEPDPADVRIGSMDWAYAKGRLSASALPMDDLKAVRLGNEPVEDGVRVEIADE
jgi:hypothetical protein